MLPLVERVNRAFIQLELLTGSDLMSLSELTVGCERGQPVNGRHFEKSLVFATILHFINHLRCEIGIPGYLRRLVSLSFK